MDFGNLRKTAGELVEVSEHDYEHMLNVLPPFYARGCFAMGEPVAHTTDGVTFYWAGKRGEKFFACYGTRKQAERALT